MSNDYDESYRDLLEWRASDVSNKSLESTRRMRGLIDNSKEAGGQIVNNLDDQKAKLTAVNGHMEEVAAHVQDADENLARAECCGLLLFVWKRKGASKEKSKNDEEGLLNEQTEKLKNIQQTSNFETGYVTRITHDSGEDEMEDNLQYVHGGVHDLRNFGLQIKSEVLAQNKLIDNIAQKGENNITQVKDANRRTEKMFK